MSERCTVHTSVTLSRIHGCTLCARGSVRPDGTDAKPLQLSGPSDEASELRIVIARVLEQWQRARMDLDAEPRCGAGCLGCYECNGRREHDDQIRRELLSLHIEELKRAITPLGGPPEVDAFPAEAFAAEVRRAARMVANPPGGDRIAATNEWIESKARETKARALAAVSGGGGGGSVGTFCDKCGATLGMVDDGDGTPARMFCPQCQPDELPRFPVIESGGAGRPLRVRPLTQDEQVAMGEYLAFVQREPLPTSDAATRQRLFEARLKWPQVAALFEGAGAPPMCSLCSYPQDQCRCVQNGWR